MHKVPKTGQLTQHNFIFSPGAWKSDQAQSWFPEVSLTPLVCGCLVFLVSSSSHIVFHGLLLGMSVSLSPSSYKDTSQRGLEFTHRDLTFPL